MKIMLHIFLYHVHIQEIRMLTYTHTTHPPPVLNYKIVPTRALQVKSKKVNLDIRK
jgi:hypothetical protein